MSPIESTFSVLKSWIQAHRIEGKMLVETDLFGFFLWIAIRESNVGSMARQFFRSCGYLVSDDDSDIEYDLLEGIEEVDEE